MDPQGPDPHAGSESDLQAWVDERLPPQRRAAVQQWLARDAEAALRVAQLRAQAQALRQAFGPVAEEPVPARLRQALRAAAPGRPAGWPALAASALLALALGTAAGWSLRAAVGPGRAPVPVGVAALAREASSSFVVYADDPARPVEIGAEGRAELVRWVSARIRRQVAVPDLSAAGYRFLGGRLVATEHGPAGLFVYQDGDGGRITMLVRPMALERDTPMLKEQRGRVAGFAWAQDGLGYSVMGAGRPEAIHPLADEVRRQVAARL